MWCYRSLFSMASFFLGFSIVSGQCMAEGLFKYDGKIYSGTDLTATVQQNLHDLEIEHFLRTEALAEAAMIDFWLDEQAKAKKKTRGEIEVEVFKAADPTQKEIEAWYEENKSRLPPGYKLEQIVGDIKTLLATESRKKARSKVVEELKKSGKYAFLKAEPLAPVFKIETDGFQVRGNAKAAVTIVEFADYQCPHCKAAKAAIGKMLKKFDSKIRLVYIDFPINQSGISLEVAYGAFCAGKMGKYWEYHDLAFENQKTLDGSSPAVLAKNLKLDESKFTECLKSEEPKKFVDRSKSEGERIGISGTPGIFINGRKVKGYEEKDLNEEIEKMLGKKEG